MEYFRKMQWIPCFCIFMTQSNEQGDVFRVMYTSHWKNLMERNGSVMNGPHHRCYFASRI